MTLAVCGVAERLVLLLAYPNARYNQRVYFSWTLLYTHAHTHIEVYKKPVENAVSLLKHSQGESIFTIASDGHVSAYTRS
jgi:hypothetical protein